MRESRQEGGEPRKNFRVGQAPRFLWFAVCVFFCVLSLGEIWNSFHNTSGYSAVRDPSPVCRGTGRIPPMSGSWPENPAGIWRGWA